MFAQRVITTLWKGAVVWGSGHLKLIDTAQVKAGQPSQSCSLVQRNTRRHFRIRVWHTPLNGGSCLSNNWSSLRVETQNVMMFVMDGRTAKSFSFYFYMFC